MATAPNIDLYFSESCTDCGLRSAALPRPLPPVGDDFDWLSRDYDSIRMAMLEELAARFSQRQRWTPADMEVVLVEVLAVMLDQLSDMLDRIQTEAYLSTARRPESVYRLLQMIGFDALKQVSGSTLLPEQRALLPEPVAPLAESIQAQRKRLLLFHPFLVSDNRWLEESISNLTELEQQQLVAYIANPNNANNAQLSIVQGLIDSSPEFVQQVREKSLYRFWQLNPDKMEQARTAGPQSIQQQKRMVTVEDYQQQMENHPLVLRAQASHQWTGSWTTISVTLVLLNNMDLDEPLTASTVASEQGYARLIDSINGFTKQLGLTQPQWLPSPPTPRSVLQQFVHHYRMAGQVVTLHNALFVGVNIALSVRVNVNYFQSEIQAAVLNALGSGINGFFAPGKQGFGDDLFSSDIVETVMALEGVEAVCVNRFKRVGQDFVNQSNSGQIRLSGHQVAVCYNDPQIPEMGAIRLTLHGGQRG